ncbi:peptidoglycan lytic exotransglycosylase [Luteitalea sp. TBR-22]|uniref:transglycosylase SLT domain-containing protein n=1 Tax=Luteitalea sp. TBR-22 TaxID=2802971 RepID=UPI001AF77CC2|nr:transporter substrate-binding domain-containing protein [Luteitalea sp. TBR-22]BCS31722.1 peptidoglycan lytic exotransglycosylase [Luteitalea sp. TBR-22]
MSSISPLRVALFVSCLAASACGGSQAPTSTAATSPAPASTTAAGSAPATTADTDAGELPPVPSPYDALPPGARAWLDQPATDDLDAMVKRRVIRAGVTFNRTHYFIDRGEQRGIAYESLMNFEQALNERLKTGNLRVQVAIVPLGREALQSALLEGRVDMLIAQLTVTPEREKLVDFSTPTRTNVSEIVVTGPGAPRITSLDDLSGKQVAVRGGGTYEESLRRLNDRLQAEGKAPVVIKPLPPSLEDDDILEMVNAGLLPITVVDDYLAGFWKQVLTGIEPHPSLAVRTGGVLAVAMRKGNPKLKAAVNEWLATYGERTSFANVLQKRYLQDASYVRNATSQAERRKFEALVKYFRTYGAQYHVDPLIMAAQGFQESRLDQNAKSRVGAVGVMQLMPATGKEQGVGDITMTENNIHAGVKYMRYMLDRYYKDEPMTEMDKVLMTFASYNAGPARVRQLRREAATRGLDPNVWFGNVERIASEKIGRETVQYVSNIYKYYVAYTLALEQRDTRAAIKKGS